MKRQYSRLTKGSIYSDVNKQKLQQMFSVEIESVDFIYDKLVIAVEGVANKTKLQESLSYFGISYVLDDNSDDPDLFDYFIFRIDDERVLG